MSLACFCNGAFINGEPVSVKTSFALLMLCVTSLPRKSLIGSRALRQRLSDQAAHSYQQLLTGTTSQTTTDQTWQNEPPSPSATTMLRFEGTTCRMRLMIIKHRSPSLLFVVLRPSADQPTGERSASTQGPCFNMNKMNSDYKSTTKSKAKKVITTIKCFSLSH